MDKEEIVKFNQEKIDVASQVEVCLVSGGWKIFEEIIAKKIAELESIRSINSLKELEANKKAITLIEDAIQRFKSLKDEGQMAYNSLKKLEEE